MADNELVVPEVVTAAQKSCEILRVWIADNGLVCSLRWDAFPDEPQVWGIVLTDVARHLGNAIATQTGQDAGEVVDSIVNLFNAEMKTPTAVPRGEFSE